MAASNVGAFLALPPQIFVVLLLVFLNSFQGFGMRFVRYQYLTNEYGLSDAAAATELLLSNNKIGGDFGTDRDTRGTYGNSLQGAVEYNFTLKRLDLAHNGISHECATGLAYAMVENPALVALNFEQNHLDATAAEALSNRLRTDAQIRYLKPRTTF